MSCILTRSVAYCHDGDTGWNGQGCDRGVAGLHGAPEVGACQCGVGPPDHCPVDRLVLLHDEEEHAFTLTPALSRRGRGGIESAGEHRVPARNQQRDLGDGRGARGACELDHRAFIARIRAAPRVGERERRSGAGLACRRNRAVALPCLYPLPIKSSNPLPHRAA